LWLPKGAGPHPVVVMVHGGCWQTKVAKADLMDWAAADLARRGIAVWNIEYRGVEVAGGGYPGTFRDVAAAADTLRTVAAAHGLRLDRVTAAGHSAGGHLALWLAARAQLPAGSPLASLNPLPIAHVVSLGGLPDLAAARTEAAHACGTNTVDRLVERVRVRGAARYADTSLPPLVARVGQTLVNGADDTVAPPAVAARYAMAMRAQGVAVETIVSPGQGHFDEIAPGQPAWEAAAKVIERVAR
jgi:acetyl esterase/lipase